MATVIYNLLRTSPDSPDLFEKLCAVLLEAMGFENVYGRKGTEQGRDIDASLVGFRWYFECKFVREDVDTASFAYKFLQLGALDESQRPDFFVLLSNT
ncbi:restriction endonuclease [Candidatus Poribacteria bacterium]|nr:restriction endonuclease [Candidatus Poribacteria bacterium]